MTTPDFFRARLDAMIDLRHPLAVLATRMPWAEIESALAPCFARQDRKGRPIEGLDLFGPTLQVAGAGTSPAGRRRLPIRLMIGLLYLKHAFGESDESVVQRWAENPYWVRRETGKEQVVQVHYSEGVANHIGLKPCGVPREGGAEASVEERAGQPLSHDRVFIPDADVLQYAEGHTQRRVSASASAIRRGRRPWHVRTFLAREPGDLQADRRWWDTPAARIGKARSRSQ